MLVDVQPKYFGTLAWGSEVSLEQINTRLPYGYEVDITANSLNHNLFEKWVSNSQSNIDIRENNLLFTMQEDMTISAKFLAAPSPFLTIKVSPENAGKVIGDGEKSSSGTHFIFATPNNGFRFDKWVGSGIDDPNKENTFISFEEHTEITAHFSELEENDDGIDNPADSYFLEVSSSNTSHGLTNPSGKNSFGQGRISILAKPQPGYIFSNWEGPGVEDPNSASTYVNLDSDLLVAAIFRPASSQQTRIKVEQVVETLDYLGNLAANEETGGSIIGGTSFLSDYIPTFKAYPKDGYSFVRWENGFKQTLSTKETMSYKSAGDFLLKAIFQKKSYSVKVLTQPADKMQVLWQGHGNSTKHEHLVPHGVEVSLSASQDSNYEFINWHSNGLSIRNPKEVTINHVVKSEAIFTAIYYPLNTVTLEATVYPESGGWVIGGGEFSYNPMHPIHAKANDGFNFVRWEGSQILDQGSQQTSVNLDQNLIIKAVFEPDLNYTGDDSLVDPGLHVVEVVSSNPNQGSVTGTGVYGTGWVDIEAFSNYGFKFSHWTGNKISETQNPKTKILVEDDSLATAHFIAKPLFVNSNDEQNGWYSNDWFGTYWNKHGSPWAYHLVFGWVFAQETSPDSYWIWVNQLNGWYWFEYSTFPYLFDSSSNHWVFLSTESSKPSEIVIFRFKDNKWRRLK